MAEIGDRVELGISPGENSGMGNRRQRRLGISFLEHDTLAGQRVQIRRKTFLATQETHAIGARGVDRDEDDIWRFRPDKRACTQHDQQEKKAGTTHMSKKGVYHWQTPYCDSINSNLRQKATEMPNCMLRCAPLPRIGFRPSATSGV